MALVGREKELTLLNRLWQSPKAEFLAVYGRRRVGKTFLESEQKLIWSSIEPIPASIYAK